MPELPEVETVKSRLEDLLVGQVIDDVKILKKKSFQGLPQQIVGNSIDAVSRKAKLIKINLAGKYNLLIHLKMTGQLIFINNDLRIGGGHPTADWVKDLPSDHTRVIITFKSDAKLFFNDMRIFGWIKVLTEKEIKQEFDKYGPDAIDPEFTPDYLFEKLQRRTIAIKQALMIGKIVGGIGNIYASEALFLAGIDPQKSAQKLSKQEVETLVTVIKKLMKRAVRHGGTTFDDKFVDVNGLSGQFQDKLYVYGREGEPCYECGGQVKKIKINNRGTYYCPSCQK